jgi:hypothetical protein
VYPVAVVLSAPSAVTVKLNAEPAACGDEAVTEKWVADAELMVMGTGKLTVWLSTVAVLLVMPLVAPAVKVDVAVPLVKVVLVGLTLPKVPGAKVTSVPSGTFDPVPPFELCARSAVNVEVPLVLTAVGEAPMLSTSQGLKVAVDAVPA